MVDKPFQRGDGVMGVALVNHKGVSGKSLEFIGIEYKKDLLEVLSCQRATMARG